MAFRTKSKKNKEAKWFEIVGRIGVGAAAHPFEYVKVLIQIGHEPIPPKPTHTIFGRPALALPGVFQYMRHIRKVDGFFGLYRGLAPKLVTNLVYVSVCSTVLEELTTEATSAEETEEATISEEEKIKKFLQKTLRCSVARAAAIIVSHPFHVITIRSMAQFVGRETTYSGILSPFAEIYKNEGISGFFSGIIPRLLGELLTLWLASSVTFVINTYIVEDRSLKSYINASMVYLATTLTYPFTLVNTVMCVTGSGLRAGMPPNMQIYTSWTDCWAQLSAMGQLKRGSSILWRYYRGPTMLDREGKLVLVNQNRFHYS